MICYKLRRRGRKEEPVDQIDSAMQWLGWWAIPIIVAAVLVFRVIHEAIAGFTRGLELWPKPSKFGFLSPFYRFLYRMEGEFWFITWPIVVAIVIAKTILSWIGQILEIVHRKATRASATGEAIARKLTGPS